MKSKFFQNVLTKNQVETIQKMERKFGELFYKDNDIVYLVRLGREAQGDRDELLIDEFGFCMSYKAKAQIYEEAQIDTNDIYWANTFDDYWNDLLKRMENIL